MNTNGSIIVPSVRDEFEKSKALLFLFLMIRVQEAKKYASLQSF